MAISSLAISQFRNINHIEIEPSAAINLIIGSNGSGKTSILEALYFLGLGRSFRANNLSYVINDKHDQCIVTAKLPKHLGIARQRNGSSKITFDGQMVNRISHLVELLPIQLLNQNNYQMLKLGPQLRRETLDWGVFHVEQSYGSAWKLLSRTLKQRNILLKQNVTSNEIAAWNHQFVQAAEIVNKCRIDFIKLWLEQAKKLANEFSFLKDIELIYKKGWSEQRDLFSWLEYSFTRDKMLGFTQFGPHKADIAIYVNKKPALYVLSVGQQKILSILLKIAGSMIVEQRTAKTITHLVDDLPADLDRQSREVILEILLSEIKYSFVTCVDLESFDFKRNLNEVKKFHVEHGTIKK